MATSIPAIDTHYSGRYFRSRLEARWAVFFDVAGIAWEYEPEKFALDSGVYIPDFFLPGIGNIITEDWSRESAFLEVKGAPPDQAAIDKACDLGEATDKPMFIFSGSNFDSGSDYRHWRGIKKCLRENDPDGPIVEHFQQCPYCGIVWLGVCGSHYCLKNLDIAKRYDVYSYFDQDVEIPVSPMLRLATEAAQSARFESPEWINELEGIKLAAKRMKEGGIFCAPETWGRIIAMAVEWTKGGGTPYTAPWYDLHGRNIADGVADCKCAHCARKAVV